MVRAVKARSTRPRAAEIEELRRRLEEAEETLRAITSGEVDALVVSGLRGEQVYTLRDADRPYRALIEQMSEGALTLDAQGAVLYANTSFADMLAIDLERVLGAPLARWVEEKERPAFTELFKNGLARSARGEITLIDSTGEHVPVELSLHRVDTGDGPILVTATALDLRERRRSVDSLRTTLQELDSNVADLQVANEELRRTNEELISTRGALENERQRYAELFDFAPDGYLLTDEKAVIREANRAAAAQFNVPPRDLIRTPLILYVDLHDRRLFLATMARFAPTQKNTLEAANLLITMHPHAGAPFNASLKISVTRGEKGEVTGLRWLIRDVTDLVQSERQVRRLNAELELRVNERTAELENANLFLNSEIEERKRIQNEILARNRELTALYAVSQAAGESLDPPERLKRILATVLDALEMEAGGIYLLDSDGETMTLRAARGHSPEFLVEVSTQKIGEGVVGRAATEKKPVIYDISEYPTARLAPVVAREGMASIAAVPILWQDHVLGAMNLGSRSPRSFSPEEIQLLTAIGHSLGIWVRNVRLYERIQSELADRKRAEETVNQLNQDLERQKTELEIANRELESFSYSVSHDLRTPLASIDGFSRLLTQEYGAELPEQGRRLLRLIQENAGMLQRLINDLLAFSRSGRLPVNKQVTPPGEIAAQALEELRETYAGRQVEIITREMPPCAVDPVLLKQVYVNLLSNAIKFTRKREIARIEVGFEQCEGEEAPAYYVRDNGVGFDPEQADRLFGVFQRLHSEDEYEGTGVGLAIVERIIKRHGGRVWAEAAVDKGATFYFALP